MQTQKIWLLILFSTVVSIIPLKVVSQSPVPLSSQVQPSPLQSESIVKDSSPNDSDAAVTLAAARFKVFTVGLNIGSRNINPGLLVRGEEDGTKAIDFENWLIPYDAVIEALKLNVTTLNDGRLEIRSSGIVTRINPKDLRNDPELGLVFSIQDLQKLFGVKSQFDINEYAIVLDIPWLNLDNSNNFDDSDIPVILEGLPLLKPGKFNIAALEQRVNVTGNGSFSPSYTGDFQAVGTAFDGSWFIRSTQPNLQNIRTWNIAEAQFLRQTDQTDYFVGSQPTFWQSQGTGDYWGFTLIERQGFTPPEYFYAGASDPRQRLQAASISRTISGEAEPGTLVRLVQGFGNKVIAEVLIDSSRIYRFENIKNKNGIYGSNYRVFLYPQGRLTAPPEIREATSSTVAGQIPAGTSAWVISGGLRRNLTNQSLVGNFSDFGGGIYRRWGLSQNLTVGFGGVYDESLKGLAELFWRPNNFPLQVAVSALAGNELNLNTDIRYNPSPNLSASFISDKFSSRFYADWRVLPNFSLFTTVDSRSATSGGIQFNYSQGNFYTFGRASLDTENNFRWFLLQGLGRIALNLQGNEIGALSELTYNLSENSTYSYGHALLLNYETRSQNSNDNLLTLGWKYRSKERASDGNYLWEAELGYGIGSQGNGILASLGTTVLPGMMLRGRYQAVSLTSDESSFSLELVSSLGLQRGLSAGDRHSQYFRTQGGLMIQPFLDKNQNGKLDRGESIYTENSDLLLLVNNQPIKRLQPSIQSDRINIRLYPGTYRLDIDPAGFPVDWQASTDAIAVNVVAGSYTSVMIPLIRSYTLSGVVTDAQGNAIAGVRVEAIQLSTGKRRFSVTNSAGVYYLEGLQQGENELQINGKSIGSIKLEESSEPLQEINIKQP
ncbi:carboxypeptidase-like regulatory domain-containing protein [Nostoc sp. XA010]|uniref:carboxypeptidase-like regulatory domain-containing protein n=1 Tax=Nostoc sp. XA010 TaxID=2780407 RepID=UPI001E52A9E0|nr:carboxypeptidase-like regulatory domain-containing protein [Nostoc sp. XA010]MCC5658129.1 carboxypeptidase-like regulatory domain-containing protein [Nostoc sp. XA010]